MSVPSIDHEEERKRFDAETSSIDLTKLNKHTHFYVRKSGSEIECRICRYGLIDAGKLTVTKEGKLSLS